MILDELKTIVDNTFLEHPSRRIHTLSVAKLAKKLAEIYGVDAEKAIFASYVHDLTKYWTYEEAVAFILSMNPSESVDTWGKYAIHALSGAYLSKKLGNDDEDIFNAIKYHTTARAKMSDLEKVIYISDYCEETRPFDSSSILNEATISLDRAMFMILRDEVKRHLENHHQVMDVSLEALQYYQKFVEETK